MTWSSVPGTSVITIGTSILVWSSNAGASCGTTCKCTFHPQETSPVLSPPNQRDVDISADTTVAQAGLPDFLTHWTWRLYSPSHMARLPGSGWRARTCSRANWLVSVPIRCLLSLTCSMTQLPVAHARSLADGTIVLPSL